jgi:hypothetical protein
MSRHFGRVCQNGYVVTDIEAAMRHWTEVVGVGPFFYVERVPFGEFRYRGEESDVQVSAALAVSEPLQIELLQLRNDAPSCWRDFDRGGHEGLQHISYWTDDFDGDLQRLGAAGYEIAQSGWIGGKDGRFVYLDTGGHPGAQVEISEVAGAKRALFDEIARQAREWDGSEPVRRVG